MYAVPERFDVQALGRTITVVSTAKPEDGVYQLCVEIDGEMVQLDTSVRIEGQELSYMIHEEGYHDILFRLVADAIEEQMGRSEANS